MSNEVLVESAPSGRSKCRACGRMIGKGELRMGERGPNPFGDGDATYWFHLACAACKRPEGAAAAIATSELDIADRERLKALADAGVAHPRLARIAGAGRSPSARARCRHCHEPIERDLWRLALDYWEEGRFGASGFLHATCALAYFGAIDDILARLRICAPALGESELAELHAQLDATGSGSGSSAS